jgi:hypothetical protein
LGDPIFSFVVTALLIVAGLLLGAGTALLIDRWLRRERQAEFGERLRPSSRWTSARSHRPGSIDGHDGITSPADVEA